MAAKASESELRILCVSIYYIIAVLPQADSDCTLQTFFAGSAQFPFVISFPAPCSAGRLLSH